MSSGLITGGRLIDPAQNRDGIFDLLVRDGRIHAVAPPGSLRPDNTVPAINATGWWVIPGLIDPHVHLRDPGFPHKETIQSGLRAAAAGGYTAVAAMANTEPVNDRPEVTRYMLERAKSANGARLIPVAAVSKGLKGEQPMDYAAMAAAGARLFSDDGMTIDDQALLAAVLAEVGELGFVVALHEEDRALSKDNSVNAGVVARALGFAGIPAAAESNRVRRDLGVALTARRTVHIAHVSTAESLALIRAARNNGATVTCEVTPHHFTLDETVVFRFGTNAKMNPPVRAQEDLAAVRAAIADRTVDMIATDHAPHDPESKRIRELAACFGPSGSARPLTPGEVEAFKAAANGVVGLETALGLAMELVHSRLITPARLVEMMSCQPARLLRLEAGDLKEGRAADITIVDPQRRWTVEPEKFVSLSRNTPFAGMTLEGKVMVTLVEGKIVYDARASEAAS